MAAGLASPRLTRDGPWTCPRRRTRLLSVSQARKLIVARLTLRITAHGRRCWCAVAVVDGVQAAEGVRVLLVRREHAVARDAEGAAVRAGAGCLVEGVQEAKDRGAVDARAAVDVVVRLHAAE